MAIIVDTVQQMRFALRALARPLQRHAKEDIKLNRPYRIGFVEQPDKNGMGAVTIDGARVDEHGDYRIFIEPK